MGSFKLGKMTLRSLFKKPETIMYPLEHRYAPAGLKGHVDNNIDACILCGICEKRCPAAALSVEKKEGTWSIDMFRCVQCGTCVRECPKDSLTMDPAYTSPAAQKGVVVMHKPKKAEAPKDAQGQAAKDAE